MMCHIRPLALVAAVLFATSVSAADAARATKPNGPAASAATATKSATKPAAKTAPKPAAKAKKRVDINSATAEQLKTVPGIGDAEAEKIIQGRPFPTRSHLVVRGILTSEQYYALKDGIVAVPPADPQAPKSSKAAKPQAKK